MKYELMNELSDEMDRMADNMDRFFNGSWFDKANAMLNYPVSAAKKLANVGFRQIKRPHNLITTKDKDGNVTGYSIETVYTPFKKSDIEVTVDKGSLRVRCGSKNEESGESKDRTMNHCSISYQSYEFTLPLTEDVDVEKIKAEADEGMLRIDLPLKKVEVPEDKILKIDVK